MNNNMLIYRTVPIALFLVISTSFIVFGFLYGLNNIPEDATISISFSKDIMVPSQFILPMKIIGYLVGLYLLSYVLEGTKDLFHIAPLLNLTEKNISIRKLFSVDTVNWENIEKIHFTPRKAFGKKFHAVKIHYKQPGKNRSKVFKCNASVLTVNEDEFFDFLYTKTPEFIKRKIEGL